MKNAIGLGIALKLACASMKMLRFALVSTLILSFARSSSAESKPIESNGVIGFVPKKGVALSGEVGGFFVEGGYKAVALDPQNGRQFSDSVLSYGEPYIGITLSYDLLDWLAIGLKIGNGFVSNRARVADKFEAATDYGLLFTDLFLSFSANMGYRFAFEGRLFGGGSMITPPVLQGQRTIGYNAGAGIGIRYDTLLTGVALGLDVDAYLHFIEGTESKQIPGLLAFSISPVVKYIF